jgi:hypothetical protein
MGQEVILLGAGQYGNGREGVRGSDRQLRRVTNIVDESDAYWLKCRFDAPPVGTALEGVCGGGDSGGQLSSNRTPGCCLPESAPGNTREEGHWASMAVSSIMLVSRRMCIGYEKPAETCEGGLPTAR